MGFNRVRYREGEDAIGTRGRWIGPQRGTFWVAGSDDGVHGELSGPGLDGLVVDAPLMLLDAPTTDAGVVSLTDELEEMVVDLVHGVLHDGTEVTLVGLRRYTWLLEAFANGPARQQWEVRAVVTGAHLGSDHIAGIRIISLETDYSLDWSQAPGPTLDASHDVLAAGASQFGEVRVIGATEVVHSPQSATFTRRARIEVEFNEPVDVEAAVGTIGPNLLSLLGFVVGRPDRVVELRAMVGDLPVPLTIHVDYLERAGDRDESRVPARRQVLPVKELPNGIGSLIDEWWRLREEQAGIINLISTDRAPFQFLEQRFIAVIQAAEAAHTQWHGGHDLEPDEFHRRIQDIRDSNLREEVADWVVRKLGGRNSPSLAERLRHLVWAADLGLPEDVVEELVKAKNLRNPLSHGGTAKIDPEYVYWLTQVWLWIVRREVLIQLGLGAGHASGLVRSRESFQFALRRMAQVSRASQ